ncbi:hypothetical protein MTP99_009261 [Tenebrio molitor]|nr:hypothetical protein MTP99_009261 [Tenebrio molitor]
MQNDEFVPKTKKAFLDLMLDATVDGRPLTQKEIQEEVDTFMFEGHDTTGSAMSFAIFCLANHPEVQAKALEEQRELFGSNKNPSPTYADLQSMKYLEQVIKEALRLYPVVPFFGRKTNQPHYSGRCYAYSDKIDGKLPYCFIPFSAGPRNCIGQKFAVLELKSTLSKIIRNFELMPSTPEHKMQLSFEAVLKSANGIKISLKLRV